jgi:hypothetical protein
MPQLSFLAEVEHIRPQHLPAPLHRRLILIFWIWNWSAIISDKPHQLNGERRIWVVQTKGMYLPRGCHGRGRKRRQIHVEMEEEAVKMMLLLKKRQDVFFHVVEASSDESLSVQKRNSIALAVVSSVGESDHRCARRVIHGWRLQ